MALWARVCQTNLTFGKKKSNGTYGFSSVLLNPPRPVSSNYNNNNNKTNSNFSYYSSLPVYSNPRYWYASVCKLMLKWSCLVRWDVAIRDVFSNRLFFGTLFRINHMKMVYNRCVFAYALSNSTIDWKLSNKRRICVVFHLKRNKNNGKVSKK